MLRSRRYAIIVVIIRRLFDLVTLLLFNNEVLGSTSEFLLRLFGDLIKLAGLLSKAMSRTCPLTQLDLLADPGILSLLVRLDGLKALFQ
jgi:hypothetical protein